MADDNALQRQQPTVDQMILQARGAFAKALAKSIDTEQFAIAARMVYKTASGKLLDAIKHDPKSYLDAVMQAAQLNLSVDPLLGEFYLVPRSRRITSVIGYIGLMKRARRCPGVTSIDADVVYTEDSFAYAKGSRPFLEHSIALGERGDFLGAYAIAHIVDGPPVIVVMNKAEVLAARDRSQSGSSGPWKTDFAAMAKKTPLRRLCKLLAVDDLTRAQLQREEQYESEARVQEPIEVPRISVRNADEASALLAGRELPPPPQREPGDDDPDEEPQ